MEKDTRPFFVVDSFDDNEEIFTTYGEAKAWYDQLTDPGRRITLQLVNNYYLEGAGYNYDDLSDTFTFISEIKAVVPMEAE